LIDLSRHHGHTESQPWNLERSIGESTDHELAFFRQFEKEPAILAEDEKIPSHIHIELIVLALQSAMKELELIKQHQMNSPIFNDRFQTVVNDLNKARYYLSKLEQEED
jgi:hypothetical protein